MVLNMKEIDKLIKRLDIWLAKSDNLKNRSEEKLIAYSNMPVRKFSNLASEKAANYIRIPSSISMDNLGLWYAGCGAKSLLKNEADFSKFFGVSAGYLYLSFITQSTAFERGGVERCSILRDWAAAVYFLLASCEPSNEFEKIAELIKKLNDGGNLKDLGSKVAIFCIALIEVERSGIDGAIQKLAVNRSSLKDSNGALDVYQKMIEKYSDKTSPEEYFDLVCAALDIHVKEAIQIENDMEFFDFLWEPWGVVPCEVIGYVNMVRRKFGIQIEFPDTKLGDICRSLKFQLPSIQYDGLADSVRRRAEQVLLS